MAYLCCTKHENIAIKNDNVGKKSLTLSSYIYNFIRLLKININIFLTKEPPKFLLFFWGVSTLWINLLIDSIYQVQTK